MLCPGFCARAEPPLSVKLATNRPWSAGNSFRQARPPLDRLQRSYHRAVPYHCLV